MPYRLRITGPDGKAKRLPLAKLPATVGRGEECECVIGDPQSSRKHARFETEPGTGNLRVVDMGSANGTFHNGRKVERSVVNVGDRIRVGGTILEIESDVDVAFTDESGKKLDILKSLSLDKKQEKENTKSSLFARIGTSSKENTGGNQSEAQVRYSILTDLLTAMTEFIGEEALFIEATMRAGINGLGVERVALLLRSPTSGTLEPRGSLARDDLTGHIVISRTICGYVYGKREAIVSTDAGSDPRFQQGSSILEGRVRSVLCVPVPGKDKCLGVFYAASTEATSKLEEPHLIFGSNLARLLAIFLQTPK